MFTLRVVLSLCLMYMINAEMEGFNDNNDWWAFQWYMGEPFRFKCQTSGLNFTVNNFVEWETPTNKSIPTEYDGDEYKVSNADGITNAELLVKKIKEKNHGVYICKLREKNSRDLAGKVIYGLNIHSKKYRDMTDKYSRNISIAFIATAVFIVPVATILLLWYFRYEARVERSQGKSRMYFENGKKDAPSDTIATTVMSSGEKGAYENPELDDQNVSTQL